MSDPDSIEEAERLFKLATPGPWCIESCGSKGDGSDIIGVAFHPNDPDCKQQLSGYLEEADEDGNFIEYFLDEQVAECEHYPRGRNPHNAASIAALHNAAPALFAAARQNKKLREALEKPTDQMLEAGCLALGTPEAKEAIMAAHLSANPFKNVARVKMRLRWKAMVAVLSLEEPGHG